MRLTGPEIDSAVLGEINQRTLVGGAAIPTSPVAAELNISPDELAQSLRRLTASGFIIQEGDDASITSAGHESLFH